MDKEIDTASSSRRRIETSSPESISSHGRSRSRSPLNVGERQPCSETSLCLTDLPECDLSTRSLSRRFNARFSSRIKPNRRWLSDICPGISIQAAQGILQYSKSGILSTDNGAIAIIFHAEDSSSLQGHLHIYHACTFHQSYCRCKWFIDLLCYIAPSQKEIGIRRRGYGGQKVNSHGFKCRAGRRIVFCQEINELFWYRFLQYYAREGRKTLHLEIAGETFIHAMDPIPNIRRCSGTEERWDFDDSVEICEFSSQDCGRESNESTTMDANSTSDQGTSRGNTSRSSSVSISSEGTLRRVPKKLSTKLVDHKFIVAALKDFICVPLTATCDLLEWISHDALNYYEKADADYKRACNVLARELCLYTIVDMLELALNAKYVTYLARSSQYYYTVAESLEIIEQLLQYQYGADIGPFIVRLLEITECILPKRNSIAIVGSPNSGKSWFFDMVSSFYINIGYVGNFNRHNVFPMNDCINKRLLIWNEPNIESSAHDTVKMLTGGDPCAANIKYQSNCVISRTPVIFTSNTEILNSRDSVWNSRIYYEKAWKNAPFLKEHTKKPHPLTYFILCYKYAYDLLSTRNMKNVNLHELYNQTLMK